jgi:hypothetical protein
LYNNLIETELVKLADADQLLANPYTEVTPGVIFDTKQLVMAVIEVISISLPSSTLSGNVINKLATVPVGLALAMNLL